MVGGTLLPYCISSRRNFKKASIKVAFRLRYYLMPSTLFSMYMDGVAFFCLSPFSESRSLSFAQLPQHIRLRFKKLAAFTPTCLGWQRRLWQRDEAYHREVLRANEVEVWHHLVAMEGRERWSITRSGCLFRLWLLCVALY